MSFLEPEDFLKIRPMAIVTDGLRAYQDAIPKEFYTQKDQGHSTLESQTPDKPNNSMVERLQRTIKQRNKVCEDSMILKLHKQ